MIVYETAGEADAEELARMRWDFRMEDDEGAPIVTREEFIARCAAFLRDGMGSGWTHWVARDGGRIVSHMSVFVIHSIPRPSRAFDGWGYLTNVYTRPSHRSRGIGAELIARVRAWAEAQDLEVLLVSPSEASIPFYRRAGFGPEEDFYELRLRPY